MRKITEEDFEKKYYLYKNMIYTISYSYINNRDDADDITQMVFQKYLNSNNNFNTDQDEKYWLIRVTINTSKSYVTTFWKRKVVIDEEIINNTKNEEKNENSLFDLVCSLPEKYKTVIILYYYENLSVVNISNTLRISLSTVKKRLERGRDILKLKKGDKR